MARVLNLIVHGVGEPARPVPASEAELWISPAALDSLLDAVRPRDDVRISVDDGNASDLEYVLPALRARGLQATFFVVAGTLDGPGYLTRDGLKELAAAMPIGLHGMRHRPWRRLTDAELEEEHREARAMIEDAAGRRVDEAACPFGAYDRRTLRSLRRSGFRRVYTSDGGFAADEAWLQPRTSVRAGDDGRAVRRIHDGAASARSALTRRAKITAKRWR